MNRLILALAAGIALAAVVACTPPQVSGTLLVSYDAAAAAEVVYLKSGKATPAEATTLRRMRLEADAAVQAVVAAEKAGGNVAGLLTGAQKSVDMFAAEAARVKGQ